MVHTHSHFGVRPRSNISEMFPTAVCSFYLHLRHAEDVGEMLLCPWLVGVPE